MKKMNNAQKHAKKLITILGENRWFEARWVLLIIILLLLIFLIKPSLLNKKSSGFGNKEEISKKILNKK